MFGKEKLSAILLCSSGVAVGAGFQGVVAFINLGSYYLIGIPVGCLLGYVLNHGVKVRIKSITK